jgi:DMSO/TMAO reductase YedYZ molybdopterin-dependent catalytic subunit
MARWGVAPAWLALDDEVIPFTDIPPAVRSHLDGGAHFSVSRAPVPAIDASRWRLEIGGSAPWRSLTLADLQRRPRLHRTTVFECGGNGATAIHGLVGQATWTGASLRDLLRDLRLPDTRFAIFAGADARPASGRAKPTPFARTLALDQAREPDAILAYEMNGRPLPASHGFPLRLIVPGWYGAASVKWLTRIELSPTRSPSVGRSAGSNVDRHAGGGLVCSAPWVGRQRLKSVIARVTRAANGVVTVRGIAWGDGTPLESVEVQVDGGAWRPCILEAPAGRFAWTCFLVRTDLDPGSHRVISRATDQEGRVQPTHLDLKRAHWEDSAQFARTIRVPSRRA